MKKRTLILIICAALVVSLGVGGIVYAEIIKEKTKKSNEIQVGDNTISLEDSDPTVDYEGQLKNQSKNENSLLTDDYEKNADYYCETVRNLYRKKWENSDDSIKKEWKIDWNSEQNGKQIEYMTAAYIGAGTFSRYIGFINGKHSLDLPRVSYEKVKQYESVYMSETKDLSVKDKVSYTLVVQGLLYTKPDMEFGSGQLRQIYSLDDNLTRFIVYNAGMVYGPIYIELDETRQTVSKTEYMWPDARTDYLAYLVNEGNNELLEAANKECNQMADLLLSYFDF